MAKRLLQRLASDVIGQLSKSYDLVYVDRGDRLTDEQVSALVKGDTETLFDLLSEWEDETRHGALSEAIKQEVTDVIAEWEKADEIEYGDLPDLLDGTDAYERIEEAIRERESGDWLRELIRGTPRVLLRIPVLDEDAAYSNEEVEPERALRDVGLPVTPGNVTAMRATLAECSPEFSVLLGYWIVSADVEQLYDLPEGTTEVTITSPHLYLGNPVMGSGFISEDPFEGYVTVKVEDIQTDKGAFGYSVADIFGFGRSAPSDFEADIFPIVTA